MYEEAVMRPDEQGDEALVSWGETILASRVEIASADREVPKLVRRAVRTAVKLRRHWEGRHDEGFDDWRARVDQALGGRAWLPALALARWGLEADPSPELFREVSERFRWAHHQAWMEGIGYEEYLVRRWADEN